MARLPMSMVGIGIVLMIQGIYGSYALAAASPPPTSSRRPSPPPDRALRRPRRPGQGHAPLLVVSTLGLVGLITAAVTEAPRSGST
ncbi:hypothetical protein NKG05_10220 [Oerskovia sp. M15]